MAGASDVDHICTVKKEGVHDRMGRSAVRIVNEFTLLVKLIVGDISGMIIIAGK